MSTETVRKYLFRENTRLFGILDGAMVPDLPQRLFASDLPYYCLRSGELEPDEVSIAPHLVFLPENNELTNWVLEQGLGDNWGIFIHSRSSMTEMRKHFRALLTVYTESGNAMTFRYYDPRVIRVFLPTCNGGELKTFFGRTDELLVGSESGEGLLRYRIVNDVLEAKELD
jgi:hypothetical protein